MIAPLAEADIDIFTVLDPEYYEANGQAALLDKVKCVLHGHQTRDRETTHPAGTDLTEDD